MEPLKMFNRKKILIVDDDKEILDFLTIFLEKNGYVVLKALDGAQAVTQVMQSRPHLIILDIMLPAGSGITVYNRIKQSILTQKIPIIIYTAVPAEHVKDKLPPGDTTIIFNKPCELEDILAAIKNLIGGESKGTNSV